MLESPDQYVAWDGNTYHGMPPEGWEQATDQKWWPPKALPAEGHHQQPPTMPPTMPPSQPQVARQPNQTQPIAVISNKPGRPWWQKKRIAIPIGVVVGIVIAAAIIGNDETAPNTASEVLTPSSDQTGAGPGTTTGETRITTTIETEVESEGPASFAVGDQVGLGDWELVVHSVTDPWESTDEFFSPEEGNRYLLVDVEVFYNGSEPTVISAPLCFEIQDSENRAHSEVFLVENPVGLLDGDIAVGGARRGGLVYEIPAEAVGLRLNFKCDLFSTGGATINLA